MKSPPHDHSDEHLVFPLLDAYLEALHAGRQPDREKLLAEHPELASTLECLEALDDLAPPPLEVAPEQPATIDWPPPPDPHDAPTLAGTFTPSPVPLEGMGDFAKYELLGQIGSGGMGVVYKARQKDLDRIVAIKMILAGHLASEDQLRRFHAEARAASRLHHAHVVRIHEVGQVHGQPYLAMEYVPGPSLAEVLRTGPPPLETAVSWLIAVARAVDHLHVQGIVHRDLKPSNILLDDEGRPCVTDFGLAKMLGGSERLTTTGAIVGTPSYMAPEQAAGRPAAVGPASDIYGLGAILYELLTGRPPFREDTPLDTLVQVLEGEPTLPRQLNPRIPTEVEMICLKCLEKAPERRYPTAAALADDLERFVRGEVVDARPHGSIQLLQRWARREPGLVSRIIALGTCMVIAQVKFYLSPDVNLPLHLTVMGILAAWIGASWLFQHLLNRNCRPDAVRFAWAAVDAVALTVDLSLTEAVGSPLVVAYAVLIAGAGLWFRMRLVWFMTAISVAMYLVLLVDAYRRRGFVEDLHRHMIFLVALVVLGFVIAYQVKRVRVLSRYYEHRPLP